MCRNILDVTYTGYIGYLYSSKHIGPWSGLLDGILLYYIISHSTICRYVPDNLPLIDILLLYAMVCCALESVGKQRISNIKVLLVIKLGSCPNTNKHFLNLPFKQDICHLWQYTFGSSLGLEVYCNYQG